jgi:hypothetical protein
VLVLCVYFSTSARAPGRLLLPGYEVVAGLVLCFVGEW